MIVECIKSAELSLKVIEEECRRNPSEHLLEEKDKLLRLVENYKFYLSQMPEIENRIYYKIAYEGKCTSRAIKEVAEENYINNQKPTDESWIYRKYYPKVKEILETPVKSK